jgi:hypothetical protein
MTHGPPWYWDRWVTRRRMRGAVVRLQTVPIYCEHVPEHERSAAIDRVAKALDLIHSFDRRRSERLERDRVGILLAPGYGQHTYSEGANIIDLDLRLVMHNSTESLAIAIVHEATHARFGLAGVHYGSGNAMRMERRCVEEEIAFVRRLPYTSEAEYADWAEKKRARLAHPWWTRRGRLRALARAFEAEGAPQWMIRIARFFGG